MLKSELRTTDKLATLILQGEFAPFSEHPQAHYNFSGGAASTDAFMCEDEYMGDGFVTYALCSDLDPERPKKFVAEYRGPDGSAMWTAPIGGEWKTAEY